MTSNCLVEHNQDTNWGFKVFSSKEVSTALDLTDFGLRKI